MKKEKERHEYGKKVKPAIFGTNKNDTYFEFALEIPGELIKVCIKPETIEKIRISPHPCK